MSTSPFDGAAAPAELLGGDNPCAGPLKDIRDDVAALRAVTQRADARCHDLGKRHLRERLRSTNSKFCGSLVVAALGGA
jgi:hypothetical protein